MYTRIPIQITVPAWVETSAFSARLSHVPPAPHQLPEPLSTIPTTLYPVMILLLADPYPPRGLGGVAQYAAVPAQPEGKNPAAPSQSHSREETAGTSMSAMLKWGWKGLI